MNRRRFLGLGAALGLTPALLTAGDQDFSLVNKTGFEISSLHISPHSSDEWGEDILGKDTLDDGDTLNITFHRKEKAANWDLRVEDGDGKSFTWEKLNLLEISEVTLFYRKGVATVTVTPSAGSNAIINGKVVDQDSQVGISGVNVVFLNNVGTIIAQYTTAANGTFRATVPVTAIRFHIVSASIPGTYYKAYEYNGKRYTALSSLCSAPLPTLTAGTTISLPTFIDVPPTSGPPPPPPNGCP